MGAATWRVSWPERDMSVFHAPQDRRKQKEGRWAGPTCRKTDVRVAERKATILLDGAKDVVELKRRIPESFYERSEGHREDVGMLEHDDEYHPARRRRIPRHWRSDEDSERDSVCLEGYW